MWEIFGALLLFFVFVNIVTFFTTLFFGPSKNDLRDRAWAAHQLAQKQDYERRWAEYQWWEYQRKQYWNDLSAFHAQQAQHVVQKPHNEEPPK